MEFALLSGSDEFGGSAIGATNGTSFFLPSQLSH